MRIEVNRRNKKMLLLLLFGGFIKDIPFHIVTFQSAVRLSYAVLRYKSDADIKEVIRLYLFPRFTFTPYYEPSHPLWEVVSNSMAYFWYFRNYQKGCISVAVNSLLSI